jgi:hypothetical protein
MGSGVAVGQGVGVMVGTGVLVTVGSGEGVGVKVERRVGLAGCTVGCSDVDCKPAASVDDEMIGEGVSAPQAVKARSIIGIRFIAIRNIFIFSLQTISEIICALVKASK